MTALTAARVLTVEDDPIVRSDLRLILEDAGFDVCPDARDGIEAVELAREHRPDLILIDLSVPRVDGVEAARRILDERDVPIVALIGGRDGPVGRALEAGAVAHVLKPFHQEQLVGTITDALADRASHNKWDSEAELRHQLLKVESMQRAGYSEQEIDHALGGGLGSAPATLFGRIRSLFGRSA